MSTLVTITVTWRCFVCGKTTEDIERHTSVSSAERARVFFRPRSRGWKTCDGLPVCTDHEVVAVDRDSPLLEVDDALVAALEAAP